jgi:hypothetical protein
VHSVVRIADRFASRVAWLGACQCAPWEHGEARLSLDVQRPAASPIADPPPRTAVMVRAALGFSLLAALALGAAAFAGVLVGIAVRVALSVGGIQ